MMTAIELSVGLEEWPISVPSDRLMDLHRPPMSPPTATPRQLTREALEHPFGFEALRRALTPDDHITLVLDDRLPHAAEMVAAVLEHLRTAEIGPDCVTVLTAPRTTTLAENDSPAERLEDRWIAELPDEFADVKTEIHAPTNRSRLAYLATTQSGRRLYLNRTLVEADFIIVVSGRGYDPISGYSGGEVALFPTFADEETRASFAEEFSSDAPGTEPWPIRAEAAEIAWLLGTPFFVQAIAGPGDSIADVVAGLPDSTAEGVRRLDARWRSHVTKRAETVIATISGDPSRLEFASLAKAAACAARVVKSNGRIVLLTSSAPEAPEAVDRLRSMDDPAHAAKRLAKEKPEGAPAALQWCHAARHASIFLASEYPEEFVEELFATALTSPSEVQRLIDSSGEVLIIPDADKSLVTVLRSKG